MNGKNGFPVWDSATLSQLAQSDKVVMVIFWADYCPYSQSLVEYLASSDLLTGKIADRFVVGIIDNSQLQEVGCQYEIGSTASLVIMRQREILYSELGFPPYKKLWLAQKIREVVEAAL
ncbi:MAG: thioredoxin domain-containing protein [Patescibacteria group bacterium]